MLTAETWPLRYKLHKYWGRKPANVVSRYIADCSAPSDLVLDPFAGSGVTLVEGARLGRRAVGLDINPFAVRLSNATLSPPLPAVFEHHARNVLEEARRAMGDWYETTCDGCKGVAELRSVGYVEEEMVQVRYRCEACRRPGARTPTREDRARADARMPVPADAPDDDIFYGWEMQKLKRKGKKRWSELFTRRNFVTAALLRKTIAEVDDAASREWLLLTLTASLAQCTRMIADSSGDAGGPSWKINCYWLPKKWQELSPLWYFENRMRKSLDAILDLRAQGAPFSGARAELCDSRTMPLQDASVDYIFTDPPYGGEGIQYGELSLLWCLWLGEKQDLGSEIAFNPYRKLAESHYRDGLARVMEECFRVLKPGRLLTITFANKDPEVWEALLRACGHAGFLQGAEASMKRSAPSLTETTMPSAPKEDRFLMFRKPAV